ncbi:MAG: hypothetical protein HQ593_00160 [Candidatus Omnitrophica bacterium]|nr:hypothetical protein [Candidatus Omnitrophota bacterium]
MPFDDHFKLTDDVISHLDTLIGGIADPFITSRYIGFISVSAATVYELSIKDIFCEFGTKKHKVLGNFTQKYFDKINGRIKTSFIKDYIAAFGEKYVKRYRRKIEQKENELLKTEKISMMAAYNNIIEWRNLFAHEGKIPATVTYEEAIRSYNIGKEVIRCLAASMCR